MSLFFLLIGLEMKYHLVEGEYVERKKLILPASAAIGGLVIPALIYAYFNYGQETIKGWAIPIATDTAFVLCIISFFGKAISTELRIFIIGLSLIDDAFAVLILAFLYTSGINPWAISLIILMILILTVLNLTKVSKCSIYLSIGAVLWCSMVATGIHGTLAGIVLSLFIPVVGCNKQSPLKELEQKLHPIVSYFVVPIFVFVNSEVPLHLMSIKDFSSNLSLGIIYGLFLGKQLGAGLFSYIILKLKCCSLPHNTSWIKYYGICVLSGVGFTLSLFIGGLSFSELQHLNTVRLAVIIGSILSAILGVLILKYEKALSKMIE
jgi:NhaA family Na+:H+ antiporter